MDINYFRHKIINAKSGKNHYVIVWNMVGTLLMSMQAVIMLAIINRLGNTREAGVFAIASTLANQFVIIGNFSMRTFQASDTNAQYSFHNYLHLRVVTISIMITVALLYCIYLFITQHNNTNKILVIIFSVFLKVVDALEDVYNGHYHQKGRLDIAAKYQIFRHIVTLIFFTIIYYLSSNLSLALFLSSLCSLIILFMLNKITINAFVLPSDNDNARNIKGLFWQGFPLFIGSFLLAYIGNSAKYSIDQYQTEEIQAYYSFIFMPVFMISLINGLLYNPYIDYLSNLWNTNQIKKLKIAISRYVTIIIVISLVCIVASYFCGIPILNFVYATELSQYAKEFTCLMIGGGLNALIGFNAVIITIMRKQKTLLLCYLVGAVIAYVLSVIGVKTFGITGAALSYTISMIFVCLTLAIYILHTLNAQGEH